MLDIMKFPGDPKFKTIEIDYPLQQDGSSCGILVCPFGRNIVWNKSLNIIQCDPGSINKARKEIWDILWQNRDTERCCSCKLHDDPWFKGEEEAKWINCNLCGNAFHYGCARR